MTANMARKYLKAIFFVTSFCLTYAANFNEGCTEDRNCDIPNLVCIKGLCNCEKGSRYIGVRTLPDSQLEANCEVILHAKCTNSEDCTNMEAATCENQICICAPGFTPSPDSKQCLKVSTVGEPCTTHEECTTTMGTGAECNSNKCECKEGFHVNSQISCIKSKGIHDACESNDECYQKIDDKNVLTCTNKVCSCINGYEEAGDTCSGSSGNVASVGLLSFFFSSVYFAFHNI